MVFHFYVLNNVFLLFFTRNLLSYMFNRVTRPFIIEVMDHCMLSVCNVVENLTSSSSFRSCHLHTCSVEGTRFYIEVIKTT